MGVKFLNIENGTFGRLWSGDVFGLWGSRRQQVWPKMRVGGASSYSPSVWSASALGSIHLGSLLGSLHNPC